MKVERSAILKFNKNDDIEGWSEVSPEVVNKIKDNMKEDK